MCMHQEIKMEQIINLLLEEPDCDVRIYLSLYFNARHYYPPEVFQPWPLSNATVLISINTQKIFLADKCLATNRIYFIFTLSAVKACCHIIFILFAVRFNLVRLIYIWGVILILYCCASRCEDITILIAIIDNDSCIRRLFLRGMSARG